MVQRSEKVFLPTAHDEYLRNERADISITGAGGNVEAVSVSQSIDVMALVKNLRYGRADIPIAGAGGNVESISVSRSIDVLALLRADSIKDSVLNEIAAMENVGIRAGVGTLKGIQLSDLTFATCDLLLLDVDLDDAAELAVLKDLIKALPAGRAIVVTSGNSTVNGMRHLMRLGIVDLVPQPIKRADLLRAFGAAIDRVPVGGLPPSVPSGKLLSFLNACGGMGATSIAVQSACTLAKPNDSSQVLLIDLDIQYGNVATYLDLTSKNSILDLQAAGDRIDGSMLRSAVISHRSGVDVLAAPKQIPDLGVVTAEGLKRLFYIAQNEYAYVLVDLPRVWNEWTRAVLAASNSIILVLQTSVPTVRQAQRQIDRLGEEGLDRMPLELILNRHETGLFRNAQGGVMLKDAEKALNRKITHTIANNSKVMLEAVNRGLPLTEVVGGKPMAKQIGALMKRIIAQIDAEQTRNAVN